MNRCVFASAVTLLVAALSTASAVAQTKTTAPPAKATAAAPTTPAPAAPAKWVAPVKGLATVDMVPGPSKIVGKEIVTTLKLKNTSTGSINLLKVDELWYDKSTPRKLVSSATTYYRKPFLPGEIIDVELRAPVGAAPPDINMLTFAHANGSVKASKVKAF